MTAKGRKGKKEEIPIEIAEEEPVEEKPFTFWDITHRTLLLI
jgi:hypothetical protein